jgi:hypothetical protein
MYSRSSEKADKGSSSKGLDRHMSCTPMYWTRVCPAPPLCFRHNRLQGDASRVEAGSISVAVARRRDGD